MSNAAMLSFDVGGAANGPGASTGPALRTVSYSGRETDWNDGWAAVRSGRCSACVPVARTTTAASLRSGHAALTEGTPQSRGHTDCHLPSLGLSARDHEQTPIQAVGARTSHGVSGADVPLARASGSLAELDHGMPPGVSSDIESCGQ